MVRSHNPDLDMDVTQFPILLANARSPAQCAQALEVIFKGTESGTILNSAYQDAKSVLNNAASLAYEKTVSDPFFYGGKYQDQDEDVSVLHDSILIMSLHDVISARKKIDRVHAQGPAMQALRAFANELFPLALAVADLKNHTVKRIVRTEEERAQDDAFTPPAASDFAGRAVYELLCQVTENQTRQLCDLLKAHYSAQVDAAIAKDAAHELGAEREPIGYPVTFLLRRDPRADRFIKEPDLEEKILSLAEIDSGRIRDQFLGKNLRKIASIVEKKGGPQTLKSSNVLSQGVSLSGMRGTFRFDFLDDSGFTVKNSVVLSHSIHDRPFLRFPLTFHEVCLPGGAAMRSPSEERMHIVFLREEAGDDRRPAAAIATSGDNPSGVPR